VIQEIANAASAVPSCHFAALYSGMGRPSIGPEKLLRTSPRAASDFFNSLLGSRKVRS